MSETLEKMIQAAKAGGSVLKEYFGQSLEIMEKSSAADFKTKADLESERVILDILKKDFPEYNILSEEDGVTNKNSEYTFVVDPLDGTNNFVLGIPNFTVSIGLFKGDYIVAGVVYVPIIEQVYYAETGSGAFCNGVQIKVSSETDIQRVTFCHMCTYGTPYSNVAKNVDLFGGLGIKRIMTNWSVAYDLCLLASGKVEGIINDNVELHDFPAGKIIAREAGAIFSNFDGSPEIDDKSRMFIGSNTREIQKVLIDTLKMI